MYTKNLAQGTKFGSGTTGLDNPAVGTSRCLYEWCVAVYVCTWATVRATYSLIYIKHKTI